MSKHLSITRFVSAVLLLDIVLIVLAAFGGSKVETLLSGILPGKFGAGMGTHMTGNHLLGALIVHLDALLFLAAGFAILLKASRQALMIGAGGISKLLRGTAGLSREDIAATSFAVAEEQQSEIHTVTTGRNLVWIGAVLLLLAFPAVCFTYAQADSAGAPLLRDAGGAVANTALTVEDVAIFAADQLADAVLLDIPRVYKWHATSLTPGDAHMWLKPFVLLYHILDKLIVLATLFAAWRSGHLRAYLLGMAGLDAGPGAAMARAEAGVTTTARFDQPAANDHHPPPAPVAEEPLPPQPAPLPLWEHGQEHEPASQASIPEVPVYVEPAPEHLETEEPVTVVDQEEPLTLDDALLETPLAAVSEPASAQQEVAPEQDAAAAQSETEAQPTFEVSVLDVPVTVEAAHPDPVADAKILSDTANAAHPDPDADADEKTLSDTAEVAHPDAIPDENHLSDAPLALHELKTPADGQTPVANGEGSKDEGENALPLPYKNTALHLNADFDA